MKLVNATFCVGFDWEAVYDQYGNLMTQDHSIDWPRLLQRNCMMVSRTIFVDEAWLSSNGIFPDKLSEVMAKQPVGLD